jgi:hypothetical protein
MRRLNKIAATLGIGAVVLGGAVLGQAQASNTPDGLTWTSAGVSHRSVSGPDGLTWTAFSTHAPASSDAGDTSA